MHKPSSASKVKRCTKFLAVAAACYAAYVVGTALLITGHEAAHFVGAGLAPDSIAWSPSEEHFSRSYDGRATLVYYANNFLPAVTGSAFFDPAMYTTDPSLQAVAAAWMGPISDEREAAVTLYPFYLAAASALAAGLLALFVRRLPVFTFGIAIGMGGFYTTHHLMEAGLSLWQAVVVGFLVMALYTVPATCGFWMWCKKHVRPRPRTFRPMPRVRGYTVMPYAGGVQFRLTGLASPSKSVGEPFPRGATCPKPRPPASLTLPALASVPTVAPARTAASTWPSTSPAWSPST